MIAMILLGANIFGYFFTLTQVTQELVQWVGTLPTSRWVIMTAILVVYIILGAFMDQIAILVLTVPIVLPLILALHFDPIWFGVIVVVTAEVGLVTPPMGLNCFVVAFYREAAGLGSVRRHLAPCLCTHHCHRIHGRFPAVDPVAAFDHEMNTTGATPNPSSRRCS